MKPELRKQYMRTYMRGYRKKQREKRLAIQKEAERRQKQQPKWFAPLGDVDDPFPDY